MRRHDTAPLGRQCLKFSLDFAIERRQFILVAACVLGVMRFTFWIDFSQGLSDGFNILHGVAHVLPGVGVAVAVMVVFAMRSPFRRLTIKKLTALAGDDDAPFVTGGLDESIDPAFEPKAVDHY